MVTYFFLDSKKKIKKSFSNLISLLLYFPALLVPCVLRLRTCTSKWFFMSDKVKGVGIEENDEVLEIQATVIPHKH